jgi:ribosomal protein S21
MIKIYNNNIEKALEKLRLLTNKEKKDLKRHEFFESRNSRREKRIREKLRNKKLKSKGKAGKDKGY